MDMGVSRVCVRVARSVGECVSVRICAVLLGAFGYVYVCTSVWLGEHVSGCMWV